MIDVGWLGSPVDVATFLVVLAERRDDVDDDRLQDELDVDDREVESLRPKIVYRNPEGDES